MFNFQVSKLLGLTPGSLKDIRVGRAEVTFKVTGNNKNYNSTDVLNSIGIYKLRFISSIKTNRLRNMKLIIKRFAFPDVIRGQLKETLGVEVIRAGIGDKVHLETYIKYTTHNYNGENNWRFAQLQIGRYRY